MHSSRRAGDPARQLADFIEAQFATETAIDLVGFSMGGEIAGYYVQRLARCGRVARLITISSSHKGTWTAFCLEDGSATDAAGE